MGIIQKIKHIKSMNICDILSLLTMAKSLQSGQKEKFVLSIPNLTSLIIPAPVKGRLKKNTAEAGNFSKPDFKRFLDVTLLKSKLCETYNKSIIIFP